MNILAFISYVLITSFTPGPNNITSMTLATKGGFRHALRFALGVCVGFGLLMSFSAAFGAFLFQLVPQIANVMKYIGAAYILFLAYTIVRDKPKKKSTKEGGAGRLRTDGFLAAVLFQFINPKGIIFSLTLMSNYILPHYNTFAGIAPFILLLMLTALASNCTWALLGTAMDRLFSRYKKVLNWVLAALLLYCAITLIYPQ